MNNAPAGSVKAKSSSTGAEAPSKGARARVVRLLLLCGSLEQEVLRGADSPSAFGVFSQRV